LASPASALVVSILGLIVISIVGLIVVSIVGLIVLLSASIIGIIVMLLWGKSTGRGRNCKGGEAGRRRSGN
jgi:hypothetical protein